MDRSPSALAQYTFDASHRLSFLSYHSSWPVRLLARAANRFLRPIAHQAGINHSVSVNIYGRLLTVPAEHPLASILIAFPQYNRPLGLAIQAISALSAPDASFSIIDVGANVGETIAIIEQYCPGRSYYLCVEADRDIARLCAVNYAGNDRVEVKQGFIGEDEGASVKLEDDGRANPSVKPAAVYSGPANPNSGCLIRLDTLAACFAQAKGMVTLIKVDTEGYDFSVLRSAPQILAKHQPAIYFEWYPRLILGLGEEVAGGFAYLASLGYRHFVFFTGRGDYYCQVSDPEPVVLLGLASIASGDETVGYFDVFAATREAVCNQLVGSFIALTDRRKAGNRRRRFEI